MDFALSEIVKQFSYSFKRGSISAIFIPLNTSYPSLISPLNRPSILALILKLFTVAIISSSFTISPICFIFFITPLFGECITLSPLFPAISPGTPVFFNAKPFSITRPRLCPRIVSIT